MIAYLRSRPVIAVAGQGSGVHLCPHVTARNRRPKRRRGLTRDKRRCRRLFCGFAFVSSVASRLDGAPGVGGGEGEGIAPPQPYTHTREAPPSWPSKPGEKSRRASRVSLCNICDEGQFSSRGRDSRLLLLSAVGTFLSSFVALDFPACGRFLSSSTATFLRNRVLS